MAEEFEPQEHGPLRDGSIVWRVSMWAGAATVAVAAAVLLTQSDLGLDRMVQAMSQPVPEKVAVAPDELVKRAEAQRIEETRRLEARIRELINDRDRLTSRIATLENNFGDLTGSIKRDIAAITATAKPLPVSPSLAPAPMLTAPPATTATVAPASEAKVEPKANAKIESKTEAETEAKPETKTETKVEPAPEAAPKVVTVPMPAAAPTRVASAPTALPQEEHKAGIGIELGGARSVEILNARWAAVKANFGPLIEGLSPLMRHDDKPGVTIPYRLIVGPLPNRAAAAQLCSRFAVSKVACRTTDFSGEKIAQ